MPIRRMPPPMRFWKRRGVSLIIPATWGPMLRSFCNTSDQHDCSRVSLLPIPKPSCASAGRSATSYPVFSIWTPKTGRLPSVEMSALDHSRPTQLAPVPTDVRCYSNSDQILRRSEMTRCANRRHPRRKEITGRSLFHCPFPDEDAFTVNKGGQPILLRDRIRFHARAARSVAPGS